LKEVGVACLSDIHFGNYNEGEGQHLRFSYATSTEHIKEGMIRIKKWVEDNKN